MNFMVLLLGLFIIGVGELNIWIGKYIFVDKVERNYKEKGKYGTFKVKYISYVTNHHMDRPDSLNSYPTGELYDEHGKLLTNDYAMNNCSADVGETIDIEYYENTGRFKFDRFNARQIGYKEPSKFMNGLMIFFLILGLIITIPISIF